MNADDLADDATQIAPTRTMRQPSDEAGALTRTPEQDADATVLAQPTKKPVAVDDATVLARPTKKPAMVDDDATVLAQPAKKPVTADADAAVQTTATFREIHKVEKSEALKTGSILNKRFVLKEVLGSGGMGTVFRATDLRRQEAQDQQTDVALKVLNEEFRDDPELFIALQRETKKSQMLAHPNIVSVYDFDRDGRNIFMVMEILEGKSLSQYIREIAPQGGIPFDKAWPIIKGLALALGYAHKKNIVHSDFKPGNVFITDGGEVKVLDFGIACAAVRSDRQGHDDTVFNARDLGALTPAYASLEMFENQDPDPRDDIYALACVSYELLAGKHPFGKLSAQKALEVNLQPPVIPGLKRRQWNALTHALALKREQRTASITQFLDEIEPKSPWPKVLGAAAIAALIAAAGGYVYIYQNMDAVPEVVELTPEQQLQIKDLLELAQIHFEVGYITAPSGSNALWAYRQVLAIDPYNKDALQGLEKIADLIEKQANELFDQQKFDESLAKIEEGLEALPKRESLLALKEKILQMKR
jgi:serine/threonine protein kinase